MNANYIRSIYNDCVNQERQERKKRVNNTVADIIGDITKAAAKKQLVHFIKAADIPNDIRTGVIDALIKKGFSIRTRLINGYQTICIRF